MTGSDGLLSALERWSPTLFLVGGVVLIGFAASLAAIGLMDMSVPRDLFAGVGFTLSFLGLIGVSAGLTDQSPSLARAGAVFAALGAVGFALTFVFGIADLVAISLPAWVEAFQLLNIVGLILGFLLVGIASLRTDAHSRPLGGLLLVPALVFAVNFGRVVVLGAWTPAWAPFILGSLQALAMLALGYLLRAEAVSQESTERPTDTAA